MRPDLYTKAILTVIAIALTVIACKPLVSPNITASAESAAAPFAGVQFTAAEAVNTFFDTRTGEVWQYVMVNSLDGSFKAGELAQRWKVTKLGQPMVKEYPNHTK